MPEWKRHTEEIRLENLHPDFMQVLNDHLKHYRLRNILDDVLMCVATDWERLRHGAFGGPKIMCTVAMITPCWLICIFNRGDNEISVTSAQLKKIIVEDYAKSIFNMMIPGYGIHVDGKFTGSAKKCFMFLGLGGEPAGKKFQALVFEAVENAKKME